MSLKDDIDKIEREVDLLVDELDIEVKEFIEGTIVTPNWKEVQKKKNLYKGYRKMTIKNDKINRLLVKVGDTLIALRDLKNSLKVTDDLPMQLLKKVRGRLNKNIGKVKQYRDLLEKEKDSYDQALRFYNSAQYILGSPRMSGIE